MSQAASYVDNAANSSGDAGPVSGSVPAPAGRVDSSSIQGMEGVKKRYKYHDRGDGMFEAARDLGRHPHLVRTGRHAGRSNVRFVGKYDGRWDLHLWVKGVNFSWPVIDIFRAYTFTSLVNVWIGYLFLWMTVAYTISYLFFGILWHVLYKIDSDCVHFGDDNAEDNFLAAYMFSLETQATIGFGSRVVGVCGASAVVLTFQNVFGMILDAVSLGVIFAKLSHPKHRGRSIFISECATIARRDGQLKFMIRIADIRSNTALDAKVSAYLYTWGPGRNCMEGEHIPVKVEPMELPRIDAMLLMPTILEHPIDERSPLFNLNHDNLAMMQAEIVITFEATSEFGDVFMVRQSYLASEIRWGHMFVPITHRAPPGDTRHIVDLSLFHDVQAQAGMPQLPPGPLSRHVLSGGVPGLSHALPYPAIGENTLAISEFCTMTTRDKQKSLMLRVGDTRPGQNLEAHVRGYLYEWNPRKTKEGDPIAYTIKEIDFGYDKGADRLILRFPQTISHTLTPESPLAPWGNPRTMPAWPAEIVVIVESVMFFNSANVMRTVTYRLPQDLKHDHSFAQMVTRGKHASAIPVVNWQAFHAVVPTGQKWVPPQASARGEASAAKAESTGQGGGQIGLAVQPHGMDEPAGETGPQGGETEMTSAGTATQEPDR